MLPSTLFRIRRRRVAWPRCAVPRAQPPSEVGSGPESVQLAAPLGNVSFFFRGKPTKRRSGGASDGRRPAGRRNPGGGWVTGKIKTRIQEAVKAMDRSRT